MNSNGTTLKIIFFLSILRKGVGKTCLARKWAQAISTNFPDSTVYFYFILMWTHQDFYTAHKIVRAFTVLVLYSPPECLFLSGIVLGSHPVSTVPNFSKLSSVDQIMLPLTMFFPYCVYLYHTYKRSFGICPSSNCTQHDTL